MKLKYDFENPINFSGKHSLKWDNCLEKNITPMWVADMDFQPAPQIKEALHRYAEGGAYGYAVHPEELTEVLIKRMKKLYDWETSAEDYIFINGVLPALTIACRTYCAPSTEIINFTPVYYPFLCSQEYVGLPPVNIPLLPSDKSWMIDFNAFQLLAEKKPGSILQFCNPHNPIGKIYTRAELTALGKICIENKILITSDEIHCDLILNKEKKHIPIASLSPELSQQTITMMAPNKTWSIPGLQFAFMIIQNKALRSKVQMFMNGLFYGRLSGVANAAALAAYRDSNEWLEELLLVLRSNRDSVFSHLGDINGFSLTKPLDATYLAWLDYRQSKTKDLKAYLEKHAAVELSDGTPFGPGPFGGNGWVRLNFATTPNILLPALERIRSALLAIY